MGGDCGRILAEHETKDYPGFGMRQLIRFAELPDQLLFDVGNGVMLRIGGNHQHDALQGGGKIKRSDLRLNCPKRSNIRVCTLNCSAIS